MSTVEFYDWGLPGEEATDSQEVVLSDASKKAFDQMQELILKGDPSSFFVADGKKKEKYVCQLNVSSLVEFSWFQRYLTNPQFLIQNELVIDQYLTEEKKDSLNLTILKEKESGVITKFTPEILQEIVKQQVEGEGIYFEKARRLSHIFSGLSATLFISSLYFLPSIRPFASMNLLGAVSGSVACFIYSANRLERNSQTESVVCQTSRLIDCKNVYIENRETFLDDQKFSDLWEQITLGMSLKRTKDFSSMKDLALKVKSPLERYKFALLALNAVKNSNYEQLDALY